MVMYISGITKYIYIIVIWKLVYILVVVEMDIHQDGITYLMVNIFAMSVLTITTEGMFLQHDH